MIVGFCGNLHRPSRSRALVEEVARRAALRFPRDTRIFDVVDLLPDLAQTVGSDMPQSVGLIVQAVREAQLLVVGTPVYKASYTGLFKHFIDLLEPQALAGKPVIVTATGGGDGHALVVEHQLRPLFGFFASHCAATAIYAKDSDLPGYSLQSDAVAGRIERALDELAPIVALQSGASA